MGAPASGAWGEYLHIRGSRHSFQSSGCPSEWGLGEEETITKEIPGFQSSGCPSEWGLLLSIDLEIFPLACFQSSGCPSEWGLVPLRGMTRSPWWNCFQSSGCPSEWGHLAGSPWQAIRMVSNQVGAPASGARSAKAAIETSSLLVSNQVGAPASGAPHSEARNHVRN